MASADRTSLNVIYGLIYDIEATLNPIEITSLIRECFSIQVYSGIWAREALFICDESEHESLINSMYDLFEDKFRVKILTEKEKVYRIEIISNQNKKLFIDQMKRLCGVELVDENHLKCIDYQFKLMRNHLSVSSSDNEPNPIDAILTELKQDYRLRTHYDLDTLDISERLSSIDLLINKSNEARTASPVHFEFHYKGFADFEVILMEKNLLKIKADCLLNTFTRQQSFSNINIEILNKAGQQFRSEFFNNFEDDSQELFMLPSFRLDTYQNLVNMCVPLLCMSSSLSEIFQQTFQIYTKIFNTVNEQKQTSLALTFVDLSRNDFELSLIGLCEALTSYTQISRYKSGQTRSFKKLIISSLDLNALHMLKDYLENGYDKTILNELNKQQDQEQNQHICIKCKSSKLLLRDFNFHDFKCDMCELLFQASQVYFKCLANNNDELVCFKCAIKLILNQIKMNHCSSCLREESRSFVNQYCLRHTACSACIHETPSSLVSHHCYICSFVRLYSKFSKLESEFLIDNHNRLKCCYDFCDLSLNAFKHECGHTSKCNNHIQECQYCAIFKVLKLLAVKHGFELNELFQSQEQSNQSLTLDEETEKIEPNNGFKTFSKITSCEDSLPGYEDYGTISISLLIPDGIQTQSHPRPGEKYYGCMKTFYLPKNQEGCALSDQIIRLFESGRLFKLNESNITKNAFIVTCNDVSFKTSKTNGPQNNGFPDPDYLSLLKKQLENIMKNENRF